MRFQAGFLELHRRAQPENTQMITAPRPSEYSEIIISHPGTDFDSLASMWAAHLLAPHRPVVFISGEDSNVREFLALYGSEFPHLRLKEMDISVVKHITIVDCSSRSQLSRIEGLLDRTDITVEIWDHHREQGPDFRVDKFHYSAVGANTTLLVQELKRTGIVPSATTATLLMLGIYEDTGSLRFPTTSPADLEAASWLLVNSASLESVDRFLDIRLTPAQKSLLTTLSLNVRVVEVKGIPIHVTQASAHQYVDEIAYLARKVQETESADVLFTLVQLSDRVFIVGRSRLPSVDVGRILSMFGGGGHAQAASCLLIGTTHPIALQRLLDAVREMVQPSVRARDIMSHPVKTIGPDASITEASTIIAHTGHSGLVVVDEADQALGIITRREVDKAIVHGLGHAPVKGYMVRETVTVGEETGLGELQTIIIEHNTGFLPVLFAGKLSGVVTRTDVLGAIHKVHFRSGPDLPERLTMLQAEDKGRELLSLLPPRYTMILAMAGEIADADNVNCFLVGGIVRDLILNVPNVDIDLLIEGDGIHFAHKLGDMLQAKLIENARFRTAKLVLPDGLHIDITTAREEYYGHPGALPTVEAASIRDDLLRRDFTINTIAIQLNSRKWGMLVDHFGGMEDLNAKTIRVLHTFSFVDDPTRIIRALRFSARYDFPLEKQTDELLKRALLEGRLDAVSPERVRDEILLCLNEDNPWVVLHRMCEDGVFGLLHPALHLPVCLASKDDPLKHAIDYLTTLLPDDELPKRHLVYIAHLISMSNPKDAEHFIDNYHFDNSARTLAEAIPNYTKALEKLKKPGIRPSGIVRLMEDLPSAFWPLMIADPPEQDAVSLTVTRYITALRHIKPEIDGDTLIQAGYAPGRGFKNALDEVRRAKLDGEISGKDEEMALAKKVLGGK
jgi:tRNA nucleotidyltransferase (CCA-adding enzyme)